MQFVGRKADSGMDILIKFLAVFFVLILGNIFSSLSIVWNPGWNKKRSNRDIVYHRGSLAVATVLVVWLVTQPGGLSQAGLDLSDTNAFSSFLAGLVFIAFALFLAAGVIRLLRKTVPRPGREPDWLQQEMLGFQSTRSRIVYVLVLSADVLIEDLVYRGFLVLTMSRWTGALLFWSVFSVLLSVVVHLYQGRRAIAFHLAWAAGSVAVTALTGSILAPLGAHLFYDFLATRATWRGQQKAADQATPAKGTAAHILPEDPKRRKLAFGILIAAVVLACLSCSVPIGASIARWAIANDTNASTATLSSDGLTAQEKVQNYLRALANGDVVQAYAMCSRSYQARVSLKDLQAAEDRNYPSFFKTFLDVDIQSVKVTDTSLGNARNVVFIQGKTYYMDGRSGAYAFTFDHQDGQLMISDIQLTLAFGP